MRFLTKSKRSRTPPANGREPHEEIIPDATSFTGIWGPFAMFLRASLAKGHDTGRQDEDLLVPLSTLPRAPHTWRWSDSPLLPLRHEDGTREAQAFAPLARYAGLAVPKAS